METWHLGGHANLHPFYAEMISDEGRFWCFKMFLFSLTLGFKQRLEWRTKNRKAKTKKLFFTGCREGDNHLFLEGLLGLKKPAYMRYFWCINAKTIYASYLDSIWRVVHHCALRFLQHRTLQLDQDVIILNQCLSTGCKLGPIPHLSNGLYNLTHLLPSSRFVFKTVSYTHGWDIFSHTKHYFH